MTPDNSTSQELQAYKIEVQNRLQANANLGENCDVGAFFKDTLEAKRIGLTENERFQNFLHIAGEDPILRESLYLNLREDIQTFNDAPTPREKELKLQSIKQDLELASLLGMDQESENPNYKPFYNFIVQTKTQYGPKPTPEASQTEEKEAKEFLTQIQEASRRIDDQQNAENLEKVKALAGFREVDLSIQDLALDFSREDFVPTAQDVLRIKLISEKLYQDQMGEDTGTRTGGHPLGPAAVALALNLEITNRAAQISEQSQKVEQSAPPTPPAQERSSPPAAPRLPEAPPSAATPPPPEPSSLPETREQIKEGTLIDQLNRKLTRANSDNESFDTTPQDLIDYVKTIPLKFGASIKSINALQTGERLDLKGTINGLGVDSNFEALVENDNSGGVKVTPKRLDMPFPASLSKGKVEKQIANLNNIISAQINKQIDPAWEVSGFRLTEKGIVFDFKKKQITS